MKEYELEFVIKTTVKAKSENEAIGGFIEKFFANKSNGNIIISLKDVKEKA